MINDAIRGWLDEIDGDFVIPIEAEKFVSNQFETNPVEFDAWLHANAVQAVASIMRLTLASRRARAQARVDSRVFAAAAADFDDGDAAAIHGMLGATHCVNDENTHRRLSEMTWADVDFVAARYEYLASSNAHEAKILRAIQKKLPKNGSKCVGDVFTEEQLRSLRIAA